MKGTSLALIVAAVAALTGLGRSAEAQPTTPRPRGDAAGQLGWLAVQDDRPRRYGGGWADSLSASATAGWYWTDHLKTEVDASAATEAGQYITQHVAVDGRDAFQHIESKFARRSVIIDQQYQFFQNAWFHPHVAAGAQFTWERRTDRYHPLILYEATAPPRVVHDGYTDGPATRLTVRPVVSAGFKAYMTRRTFFRSDLRFGFRRGIADSTLRAGFGVDF